MKIFVLLPFCFFFMVIDLAAQTTGSNPKLANSLYLTGTELMDSGKFAEALPFLDSAILYNPLNADYYSSRARAELSVNLNRKALYDYLHALSLSPDTYSFAGQAADIYLKIKAYDSATACYSLALRKIDPKDSVNRSLLYASRGNSYLKKEQFELAIADYDTSILINPENYFAFMNRAITRLRLGKIQEACEDCVIAMQHGVPHADELYASNCAELQKSSNPVQDNGKGPVTHSGSEGGILKTTSMENKEIGEQLPDSTRKVVEEAPMFPGGDLARINFLSQNIHYPQRAREAGIEGTVYLTFVVEKDGSITNPKILRGIGGGCDEETIRLVSSMPRWVPGKMNGEPVRVQFNMPIRFSIMESSSGGNLESYNSGYNPVYLVDTEFNALNDSLSPLGKPLDTIPCFGNGESALDEFISSNLHYPSSVFDMGGIHGYVMVSFIIMKDGSLNDIKISKSLTTDCDSESKRLVKLMQPWKPGYVGGKPVNVLTTLPVYFNAKLIGTIRNQMRSEPVDDAYYAKGKLLMSQQKYKRAIANFNSSIEQRLPNFKESYLQRGICYSKLGDDSCTVYNILKARDLNAEDYNIAVQTILFPIAKSYLEKNTPHKAIDLFTEILKTNKSDRNAYYGRGLAYVSVGNLKSACDDFAAASALGYQDAPAAQAKYCGQ